LWKKEREISIRKSLLDKSLENYWSKRFSKKILLIVKKI
jgi:hypothetical protein